MSNGDVTLQAPSAGVTVRMYRQGLGDCFLLAFPTGEAGKSYYMLIDCGVLQGAKDAAATMRRVAADIKSATGGEIHLLVVTHRHWDHISGFSQAADIFGAMTVHNLWLPWLEDPQDPIAAPLWKKTNQALAGLALAIERSSPSGDAMAAAARPGAGGGLQQVRDVLEFAGDLAAAAANADPLQPVRQLITKSGGKPDYRHRGDGPLPLPPVDGLADPGVRLYVLGPPTDLQALTRLSPGSETYFTGVGLNAALSFLMGVLDPATLSPDDAVLHDLSFPFDQNLRIESSDAAQVDFFRLNYGFDEASGAGPRTAGADGGQAAEGPAWRRIDQDWLSGAEGLALLLDNYINNTSMPLAIELSGSQKVLLFVGDAQVGNWLSWYGLEWSAPGAGATVKMADLLARTVLYKVGHHGSQNATVRAHGTEKWGLELMTSPDLVAMVPVDSDFAHKVKGWDMPYQKIMDRLQELTGGRIIRLDTGIPNAKPAALDDAAWQAFTSQVQVTDLYRQFTIGV